MSEVLLRRVAVSSDIVLEFYDGGNRYYGDYHRVVVEIDMLLTLVGESIRLRYQRPLKKMGVVSAEIDAVKTQLMDHFLESTAPYMGKVEFVPRLETSLSQLNQKLWRRM